MLEFAVSERGLFQTYISWFSWFPWLRWFVEKNSDSVKRHLRGRHLSVLNLKFDFISAGGRTREEQIALSLKRHLFPHGGREPKAFWICFSRVHPPSEIKSNFKFKTLKRHLLKRHLTLSEKRTTPLLNNSLPALRRIVIIRNFQKEMRTRIPATKNPTTKKNTPT